MVMLLQKPKPIRRTITARALTLLISIWRRCAGPQTDPPQDAQLLLTLATEDLLVIEL